MQNEELRRLGGKIEALKDASMFNAKERGEATLASAYRVLNEFEQRLQRIEKIYENIKEMQG